MKILYIITKSNWGGAQRHVFDLAKYCKENGHEIVVALGGTGVLNDRLNKQGISTRVIESMGRDIDTLKDISSFFKIFRIIAKEKPDILHLHSPKAGGLGALAGRIRGIRKIIYTVHGWAFNEDRPFYQKVLISISSWLTMILSTHIVTISEKEMGQASMFPFVVKKLNMIYLGISSPKCLIRKNALSLIQSLIEEKIRKNEQVKLDIEVDIEKSTVSKVEYKGLFDKKIVLGTIAELHPNKGLTYAINAFSKLVVKFPSLIFLIIGEGEQRDYLEKLVREKGLENSIILVGYVENASQYLKAFNIFILPSIKEGLPYTIIEAGYAGLPVVATAVGGIPEIIDDMKSGILIQPKKSQEIESAVSFLLEHKNLQKEYGIAIQEKVRNTFNIENMLSKTMELYKEDNKPI